MSNEKVVKFAQELLLEADPATISPALIGSKIDQVLAFNPKWSAELDRDAAISELVRRFSLWIGTDTTIKSDVGHSAWLNASRKSDWRYWQRYRELLERRMSYTAFEALDQ